MTHLEVVLSYLVQWYYEVTLPNIFPLRPILEVLHLPEKTSQFVKETQTKEMEKMSKLQAVSREFQLRDREKKGKSTSLRVYLVALRFKFHEWLPRESVSWLLLLEVFVWESVNYEWCSIIKMANTHTPLLQEFSRVADSYAINDQLLVLFRREVAEDSQKL
ncbi:hypothetical protein Tco_1265599 [Tanacetum coccineum]